MARWDGNGVVQRDVAEMLSFIARFAVAESSFQSDADKGEKFS